MSAVQYTSLEPGGVYRLVANGGYFSMLVRFVSIQDGLLFLHDGCRSFSLTKYTVLDGHATFYEI